MKWLRKTNPWNKWTAGSDRALPLFTFSWLFVKCHQSRTKSIERGCLRNKCATVYAALCPAVVVENCWFRLSWLTSTSARVCFDLFQPVMVFLCLFLVNCFSMISQKQTLSMVFYHCVCSMFCWANIGQHIECNYVCKKMCAISQVHFSSRSHHKILLYICFWGFFVFNIEVCNLNPWTLDLKGQKELYWKQSHGTLPYQKP